MLEFKDCCNKRNGVKVCTEVVNITVRNSCHDRYGTYLT